MWAINPIKVSKQIYKLIAHCCSSFQVNNMLNDKIKVPTTGSMSKMKWEQTFHIFFRRNITVHCSAVRSMTMKSWKTVIPENWYNSLLNHSHQIALCASVLQEYTLYLILRTWYIANLLYWLNWLNSDINIQSNKN